MKTYLKKAISVIAMAGIIGSLLAGCGGNDNSTSSDTPSEGTKDASQTAADKGASDSITVAIGVDPGDLSPWVTSNDGRSAVLGNVYESLGVNHSLKDGLKLILLKDYKMDDDGYTYHCEIFDNIKDSAGNDIKASDVVFSFTKAKEIGKLNPVKYVESIEATGDYTFDLVMNVQNVGEWENLIAQVYVVSQAAYEASPDGMVSSPVGTACYTLTDYVTASSISFSKRDDYWQTDDAVRYNYANIDQIKYKIIPEASQMAVALETGDVDVVYQMPDDQIGGFQDTDGYGILSLPDAFFYSLFYNCDEKSIFNDEKFRQACSYAIDRESLLASAGIDNGNVIKSFGTPAYSDYQDSWKEDSYDYYNYNPDKAKELLKESSYNGEKVNILIGQRSVLKTFAQVVQSYLIEIGVNAEITEAEAAVYNSTLRFDSSAWDIRIEAFGSPVGYCISAIAGSFDNVRFGDQGTTNFVHDDELQDLLHTAANVFTNSEDSLSALQDYMKDKCYALPLISVNYYNVYNNKVTDLSLTARKELFIGNSHFNLK